MNKHALMLTAATVALLASPVFAADNSDITSQVTTQLKTSTVKNGAASNITIESSGSVVVSVAGPVIEIDSPNSVSNAGKITNLNKTGAIGIQLDATTAGNGPGNGTPGSAVAFANTGTIDLTGSGTGKVGVLVSAPDGSGDIFNGDINLDTGTSLSVKGDDSAGLEVASGATLNGNVSILGSLIVNPSTLGSTTAGSDMGLLFNGNVNGNIAIGTSGAIQAIGYGANGLVINGAITGSVSNSGTLSATGTSTPKTTGGNPQAGSALIISNNITGGFYNAGASSTSSTTTAASLSASGAGPAIYISPGATSSSPGTAFTIGAYADSDDPNFSFLNRGTISATSLNPNVSESGIVIAGGASAQVTFTGGIFNSGAISATSTTDGKNASYFNATALSIGDNVTVNSGGSASAAIVNSNESGSGSIVASVSGSTGGVATAIGIGGHQGLSTISSLINEGTILASAKTTDTTITNPLAAYAINDLTGSLASVTNSGTISATATTLDSGKQIAVAANLSANTSGITFTNSGTVTGALEFGTGNDTLSVNGPSGGTAATVVGDISFGGTTGGNDTLNIGTTTSGSVTGAITELGAGRVNVTIGGGGTGTLTLKNTTSSLVAGALNVQDGGTFNLSLSNAFDQQANPASPAMVIAHTISFSQLSAMNVSFGSFISTTNGAPATFTLFTADSGITMATPNSIRTGIENTIPYLFKGTLCGYGIAGFTNDAGCSTTSPAASELMISLQPKTAAEVGLTGNVAEIFPYANNALATDDALGSALVTYVTDRTSAQAAYSSFLPDLSGSSRAVAISITDQATGPVGARQRALRMYASQPGGTTMWGQEFVQRLTSGKDTEAYRASGFGFALGMDGGDPRSGRYGGAVTFFSGDQTNKGPNFTKTSNEWYILTGYTDWRGKGLFLDSQLSAGYGNLNGKRSIQLTDSSGTVELTRHAVGKRNGLLVAGGVSTGVVLTYGSTVIMPQFSVDGLTIREEGYTESGGGSGTTSSADGFDLRVQPYYANSLRGYLGTAVREDFNWGDFYFQPEARVGYRYDFLADPVKLKAAFASVANTANSQFTLTGPDPERGDFVAGASLSVTTGAWSLGINYDYLHGTGGSISQTGILTLIGRI